MNTITEDRMKEMQASKELVKTMNVEAVGDLLMKVQNKMHELLSDNVDMKRMVTDVKQENIDMRAEINALKAMGFRGIAGHGSTVHNKE